MAITSLKPVKAKNKRIVISGQVYERTSKTGYTRVEARGVFGSCHQYSKAEQARIDEYWANQAEDKLAYYKAKHANVKKRMLKRQEYEFARLEAMEPRLPE